MRDVKFLPWVGKNYNDGLNGRRILVLGESHYCDESEATADITNRVMEKYLTKPNGHEAWMNTFKKFERALVGFETTPEDSEKIWNSVSFYNFIQRPIGDTRIAGTKEDYLKGEKPFFKVLNELQPGYIVVWGSRLYENMPYTNWTERETVLVDGGTHITGTYRLKNSHDVNVISTYHPSAAFDWHYWHKVLETWW